MRKLIKIFTVTLLFLSFQNGYLRADWPCRTDSACNIVNSADNQWNVRLTTDKVSGAILVWQDRRGGNDDKLYIQRINYSGNTLWQTNGIQLTSNEGPQSYPQIISDNSGGAFIVWQDNRSGNNYDIYAQRVSPEGVSLWDANGTLVCGAPRHQYYPRIAGDGLGGLLISWQDERNGNFDIYAQRYDSSGQAKWDFNGRIVCGDASNQGEPKIINDYQGGAIIAWTDYRSGSGSTDIYCQRIYSNGQTAWTINGVPVCNAPNSQWAFQIIPDSTGGAIISWQDRRNLTYDNIYAQRIDASGITKWQAGGLALAPVNGNQYYPQIASDNNGGAVVTWQDNRRGADYDIYAQRVNRNGVLIWASTGTEVCASAGQQYNPQIVSQGSSSLIVWQDNRKFDDYDICAQRLNASGQPFWSAGGVPVADLSGDQFMPQMTSDSASGAIIAWADYHFNNGSTDILAQRIGSNGSVAGGSFRTFNQDSLSVTRKRYIKARKYVVSMPNTGNIRDSVIARGAFPYGLVIGIERLDKPHSYGWQRYVRSNHIRRALSQTWAPRPFDRLKDGRDFVGEMRNPSKYRYNNRLVGELITLKFNIAASDVGVTEKGFGELIFIDNTSNGNPLNNKSLRQIARVVDSMLTMWSNYRNINYSQISSSLERINRTFDAELDTVSTKPLKITSTKTTFSVPYLRPGVEMPPALPEFHQQPLVEEIANDIELSQNYPNPFNPVTTIEFYLPEPSVVTLKIYNILGQDISVPIDNITMEEGYEVADFDASNLPTGVYFYQLIAEPLSGNGTMTQVKKMLVMK